MSQWYRGNWLGDQKTSSFMVKSHHCRPSDPSRPSDPNIIPMGSMYAIYGNMDPINIHPMLAYIPAPWILWDIYIYYIYIIYIQYIRLYKAPSPPRTWRADSAGSAGIAIGAGALLRPRRCWRAERPLEVPPDGSAWRWSSGDFRMVFQCFF